MKHISQDNANNRAALWKNLSMQQFTLAFEWPATLYMASGNSTFRLHMRDCDLGAVL